MYAGDEVRLHDKDHAQVAAGSSADVDSLALWAWLQTRRPDLIAASAPGDLHLQRVSGGQSNPTWYLNLGPHRLILRKAPNGTALPAAHAVEREFRVMQALIGSGVPVPRMLLLEEDPDILGARFYIMQRLEGVVEHDSRLPGRTADARRAIYADKARILARLHALDWRELGLDGYGHPGPFFTRQIHRWTRQWELSRTRDIPEIDQLSTWLREHDDGDGTCALVHGDFRIGNLMLDPVKPGIIGVLDWELSTLGHPLADLAHAACMWHVTPDEYGGLLGSDLSGSGIPVRVQFEQDYLRAAGLTRGLSAFHHVFALFRLAVIFAGVTARARLGTAAAGNGHALGHLPRVLARRAAEIAAGDWPV